MIIYKIEQLEDTKDLSHVDITLDELKVLEGIESTQLILEENGSYVIGLITDECIDIMTSIFKKYDIKFSITDVTDQFVKTNIFKIKSFVLSNVTVNDILDKINKSGIESLNEIDYIVLNK
jgi:hypothetical protein